MIKPNQPNTRHGPLIKGIDREFHPIANSS